MTSSAVVNRYANALVDVVTSASGGIDAKRAVEQLRSFDSVVQSSADLRIVLASPSVSPARKRLVIRRVAAALGLERTILNFLLVLSDHRRAGMLSEVIEAFDVLLDERLGFRRAEVRSAAELDPRQRERLEAELAKVAGSHVRVRFAVDSELIGGVTAQIGSKVYDGSVRGQFAVLRQRLRVDVN